MTSAPARRSTARVSTRRLTSATGGGVITRTVLPGGLRIVTEAMPGRPQRERRGVGAGRLAGTRRRRWPAASHFLEHLLFKGTATRSALDIATRDGRRRRRVQRVHREGAHLLLRDGARPRPRARDRHRHRRRAATRPSPRRTSTSNAASCSKRSRCATTTRPTSCTTSSPPRCSATRRSAGPILGTVDSIAAADPAPGARLLPAPLHAPTTMVVVGRRQRRPRRRRRAGAHAPSPGGSSTAPASGAARRVTAAQRRAGAAGARWSRDDTEQANLVLGMHGPVPPRPAPVRARACCPRRSAAG